MEIEILSPNRAVLFRPKASLENISEFKTELEPFKAQGYRFYVLDLIQLDWMASRDIGTLLMAVKSVAEVEGKL